MGEGDHIKTQLKTQKILVVKKGETHDTKLYKDLHGQ